MGDAIEYCHQCENNVGCHLARKCLNSTEPPKIGSDQRLVGRCLTPTEVAREACLIGALNRGDAWRCRHCNTIIGNWRGRCDQCGEFHSANAGRLATEPAPTNTES